MTGPLAGLRVVDLTQVLSGPFCTMVLADLGADVIKVEPPTGDVARPLGAACHGGRGGGDSGPHGAYGGYFASVNRNKRSICLDLKTPAGVETLLDRHPRRRPRRELPRRGDGRLGLSYEELHARFPKLVYATVRGFGDPRTGASPYSDWPAFDIIAQAMGGIMGVTGTDPTTPSRSAPGWATSSRPCSPRSGSSRPSGSEATGSGQLVDVAMYDSVLALTERIVYQHSITGTSPAPQGNTHPLLCPYGVVRTADGFVTVATPSDHHWRLLTEILGRPELGTDPHFVSNAARLASSDEVYGAVEEWSRQRPTAEVIAALAGRIPCGPVNTAADIAADPHVAARNMIVQVDHPAGRSIGIAGNPIKLTSTPATRYVRAPLLGEHTAEVLEELRRRDADPGRATAPTSPAGPGGNRP